MVAARSIFTKSPVCAPSEPLARQRKPLVAESAGARPVARFVCAAKRCTQQGAPNQFGGYIRREHEKKKKVEPIDGIAVNHTEGVLESHSVILTVPRDLGLDDYRG